MGTRPGGRTFLELFPQLFLVPMVLVTVAVLVYLLFIASAQDSRSIAELLADLEAGGGHARTQDAYALAVKVAELERGDGPGYLGEDETRKLLAILRSSSGDDELQGFLVYAFGRAGNPEITWPVLRGMLEDGALSAEVRARVIAGLSLSGNRAAVLPLLGELAERSAPEQWEVRCLAIQAIVNILTRGDPLGSAEVGGDPLVGTALERLRPHVQESRKEISWNTAVLLAKYFGDPAGEVVLERLLDWEFLDAQRGDQGRELTMDEKEAWMGHALEALYRLRGASMREILDVKKTDRSLPVRNVALELLEKLDDEV